MTKGELQQVTKYCLTSLHTCIEQERAPVNGDEETALPVRDRWYSWYMALLVTGVLCLGDAAARPRMGTTGGECEEEKEEEEEDEEGEGRSVAAACIGALHTLGTVKGSGAWRRWPYSCWSSCWLARDLSTARLRDSCLRRCPASEQTPST
jgi:hypothetical protein